MRIADDGPRVYPELMANIAELKDEVGNTSSLCQTGTTFEDRNNARSKLQRLSEELSVQEAALPAARYLIETQSAVAPTTGLHWVHMAPRGT
jgi:hypothetical protein